MLLEMLRWNPHSTNMTFDSGFWEKSVGTGIHNISFERHFIVFLGRSRWKMESTMFSFECHLIVGLGRSLWEMESTMFSFERVSCTGQLISLGEMISYFTCVIFPMFCIVIVF
jgi:hypothetical protein